MYPELIALVQGLSHSMLMNVQLLEEHVLCIAQYMPSTTHGVEYQLIDGSHHQRQPMEYSCQNTDQCFNEFKNLFLVFASTHL